LTSVRAQLQQRFNHTRAWYLGRFEESPARTTVATFLVLLVLLVVIWLALFAYSAYMVRTHVNYLSEVLDDPDAVEISSGQVAHFHDTAQSLDRNVRRLERLTRIPVFEPVFYYTPVAGDRYEAARTTLKMSEQLTRAGATGASIGRDAYQAFDNAGISYDPESDDDSWLMAVDRHRDDIPKMLERLEQAKLYRTEVEDDRLPGMIRDRLDTLDSILERSDELTDIAENYDQFFQAAGGDGSIRYLFLFKNPAELRPSGGFPGTFGVFEFNQGQLVDYEMWDSHDVTRDYMENRTEKLQQPWPFEQYAPQDGLILHDATWYSDFPYTAELMMQMYAETSWPEINGIVAIHPEAVSDMVSVTGPVEVDIDGELREINEDNVYDEVERYRWLRFQGEREGVLGDHKDILIDIGEAIMDEFTSSNGTDVTEAATLLMDAAERRDLQIYIDATAVQAFLDRRGWSGKLFPDPDTPTLAITYTNFVLEKASMAMNPYYDLYLEPLDDGGYLAKINMTLEHTGLHDQDPRYFGFQRWWIELALPDGAEWVDASHDRQPDPEAHNGGSYTVDLFPEETREINVEFTLPELERLMIRRQPGQVPPDVHVHLPGCEPTWGGYLVRDLYVDLSDECPEIDGDVEEDKPEMLQLS
jgi:hypothetical protein